MNSKKFYDKLESLEDKEIMSYLSATIEYLVQARNCDFRKIVKHLKKVHNYLVQINRSEENE